MLVGDNFNPEIGFVRRDDFRQNRGSVQFTPRPASIRAIRRFQFRGDVDFIAIETTGTLESRDLGARFEVEFENTDRVSIDAADKHEALFKEFTISDGITLPVGGYDFRNIR